MGYLSVTEESSVATPAAGYVRAYPKTDGYWYSKDDTGTERPMTLAPDAVTDAMIGNRIGDQALAGGSSTGALTQLFSWLMKAIKSIKGETNWYDTPTFNLTTVLGMTKRIGGSSTAYTTGGTTEYTPSKMKTLIISTTQAGISGSSGQFLGLSIIPSGYFTNTPIGIAWLNNNSGANVNAIVSASSTTSLNLFWYNTTGGTIGSTTWTIILFGE